MAIDEIRELIKDCFVTGKWAESEDAEALLNEAEDDEGLISFVKGSPYYELLPWRGLA